MVRNKDKSLRGVSVQADYLKTVCSRCGKSFLNEAAWKKHVEEVEYMKPASGEPHGIYFRALSLVVAPEEPGVSTATFQIAESINGEMKLLESVIREKSAVSTSETVTRKVLQFCKTETDLNKIREFATKTIHDGTDPNMSIEDVMKEVHLHFHPEDAAKLGEQQFEGGFQGCVDKMMSEGKDEESAKAICGSINAKYVHHYPGHETGTLGEPCSPALKACVDDLIAEGKDESSAWAICRAKIGETQHTNPTPLPYTYGEADVRNYVKETDAYLCKVDMLLAQTRMERDLFKTAVVELTKNKLAETESLQQKLAESQKKNVELENRLDKVHGFFKGKEKDVLKKADW
jgi:hypothetical protein